MDRGTVPVRGWLGFCFNKTIKDFGLLFSGSGVVYMLYKTFDMLLNRGRGIFPVICVGSNQSISTRIITLCNVMKY